MEHDLDAMLLHMTRVRLTQDYPGQIDACLDVLNDEELWWRPNEHTNAVANLLLHLSGSNRYHLQHVVAGRDFVRNRDAEFAARGGYSRSQLLETWKETLIITDEVLTSLEPSQMTQTTDRSGKVTTYAQLLLHVSHHTAAHMGQIVWITKMLRPGAIDDIWMKMRGR